jgi:hypothetical protein
MKVEIIKRRLFRNGIRPLYCQECKVSDTVYAYVIISIGKAKIQCCEKHLSQFIEILHKAESFITTEAM